LCNNFCGWVQGLRIAVFFEFELGWLALDCAGIVQGMHGIVQKLFEFSQMAGGKLGLEELAGEAWIPNDPESTSHRLC